MSLLLLFGGGVAPVTSTGTWEQSAGWAGAASEAIPSAGSWTQPPAAWEAAGISAEDIIGDGAWSQTATWAGTGSESIPSAGTWTQPPAAWAGSVVTAEDIFAEGAWEQVATWEGTASTPVTTHPPGGAAVVTGPAGRKVRRVRAKGSFTQERGNWFARGSVNDDDQVLLVLEL